MPQAQTAEAGRGSGRPAKRIPMRSHWPIFATFGLVVWPTLAVLCFLVHTAVQPGAAPWGPGHWAEQQPAPPQAVGNAIEAVVPPLPLGRAAPCGGANPCLTNAAASDAGGPSYQYAGQ
jgi:hypothetical protein